MKTVVREKEEKVSPKTKAQPQGNWKPGSERLMKNRHWRGPPPFPRPVSNSLPDDLPSGSNLTRGRQDGVTDSQTKIGRHLATLTVLSPCLFHSPDSLDSIYTA